MINVNDHLQDALQNASVYLAERLHEEAVGRAIVAALERLPIIVREANGTRPTGDVWAWIISEPEDDSAASSAAETLRPFLDGEGIRLLGPTNEHGNRTWRVNVGDVIAAASNWRHAHMNK